MFLQYTFILPVRNMPRCCCKYCSWWRFVVNSFCIKLLQYLNCWALNDFHTAECDAIWASWSIDACVTCSVGTIYSELSGMHTFRSYDSWKGPLSTVCESVMVFVTCVCYINALLSQRASICHEGTIAGWATRHVPGGHQLAFAKTIYLHPSSYNNESEFLHLVIGTKLGFCWCFSFM